MKKIVSILALILIFTGTVHAEGFLDGIKKDFDEFTSTMFRNNEAVTEKQRNRNGYDDSVRIEDEIAAIIAKRDKELEPVNRQIEEKNTQLKNTLTDSKLTLSQKKSKMTLIQSEINTLKTQKENIEAKYAKQVRETRAIY